ncbi:MAG: AAA family ATPase [Steroidobacteraceae bacterium]
MRLLELETRHWRGLSRSLGPFSPRLNLVLGPNEAGKSRLFQAIQFALFESHKGSAQHKQRLQSWSSSEAPSVRLVFEVEGRQYELQKQFLKGAMAQLAGGGATLRAEDAEAELRDLLGTRASGSRAPHAEELGIWPLLMVAQGASRRGTDEDLNDDGRARLQQRLSAEIGVAAVSAKGQQIMSRVQGVYEHYYTPTGQETVLLRNARKELAQAQDAQQAAQNAHEARERTVADLQTARAELASLSARLENAKREAAEADERAAAARRAGTQLAAADGALNTAVVTAASAEQELKARQQADEVLRRLDEERDELDARLEALRVRQQLLEADAEGAVRRVSSAEQALKAVTAALEQARREVRRGELTERRRELNEKLEELERIDRSLQEAHQQRAGEPDIGARALAHLQRLEEAARTTEAHLHGAAVSVVVTLEQASNIDGTPHPAGTRVAFDVIENRTVRLGDLATIEVRPGRGTLDALRDAKTQADAELANALNRSGVPTVQTARAAYERIQRITQNIEQLTGQARATWSKPREDLREELLRTDAEIARLGPQKPLTDSAQTLDAALTAADAEVHSARGARDAVSAALMGIRSEIAAQLAVRREKQAERERLAADWAARPTAEALQQNLQEHIGRRVLAQQAAEHCRRVFTDLGGEGAEQDARRLAQCLHSLQGRVQEVRDRVQQLTGAWHAALGVGTYDRLQDAQALTESAHVQLTRLQRKAAAAKRLWEVLSQERKRVVERLSAPVMQRVKPYLVSLFPGCDLDLGEELGMVGLRGDALSEPFEDLSGGAQEQLALLTRIGLAEVLAGEGTLPLVLDDSLVNTDPLRIRQIHRILFRAANRLQLLVFSCHDVLFDGLGAEQVFRLGGSRRTA